MVYVWQMHTDPEVLSLLEQEELFALFQWAGEVAFERVSQDYDEDAGHDQTIAGSLGYKYLVNLLDRATSCGKYALPAQVGPEVGEDLVRLGINEEAFDRMPRVSPGKVRRSNFNGSPGWALPEFRWLLQSYKFGEVDRIAWSTKSPTKQRVARVRRDEDLPVLFEYESLDGESAENSDDLDFAGDTLILAHAFQKDTGAFEIYLGRSRSAEHGDDSPWYWRQLVASGGPKAQVVPDTSTWSSLPGSPASGDVEDLKVRLRASKAPTETAEAK